MSGRNEEWEKNLEVDDLQWKNVEGESILLKMFQTGQGNARDPLRLGQACFALRTIAAYLDRGKKTEDRQFDWVNEMCTRAENQQLGLSMPVNARDDVLTGYVFQMWNESAKSRPNIDISAIPDAVTKPGGKS